MQVLKLVYIQLSKLSITNQESSTVVAGSSSNTLNTDGVNKLFMSSLFLGAVYAEGKPEPSITYPTL